MCRDKVEKFDSMSWERGRLAPSLPLIFMSVNFPLALEIREPNFDFLFVYPKPVGSIGTGLFKVNGQSLFDSFFPVSSFLGQCFQISSDFIDSVIG